MSTLPPQPEPVEEDQSPDARLTSYFFNLMEIGASVARSIGREADLQARPTPEGQTPRPAVDVAAQFERVSRAMRRTALLIRHLAHPVAAPHPARKPASRKAEDSSPSEAENPVKPEFRQTELQDRLDSLDPFEQVATRPIPEIIHGIRRDLGLKDRRRHKRRGPGPNKPRRQRTAASKPPDRHLPAPQGPDPGAPQSRRPPRDPDRQTRLARA